MNKVRTKEYIAFVCLECGMVNVYPSKIGDGNRCTKCKGILRPIGNAVVIDSSSIRDITIGVNVDTTQLDNALEKIKELERNLSRAYYIYGIDLAKTKDETVYTPPIK